MTVALIDYGAGNVPSVERALQRLGAAAKCVTRPEELAAVPSIILPGVGHYAAMIRALDQQGLRAALLQALANGTPFLGICLGLQALYASSDEAPSLRGLGVLSGVVGSLPHSMKLPHMGWNRILMQTPCPLLDGLDEADYFYFAHTFAARPSEASAAVCDYGVPFTAVLQHGNIYATQFHPEKSGPAGARLLGNFLTLARMNSSS